MKILIICHEFPPLGGGAANAAFYLAKYFAKMQHRVTILTSKFRDNHKEKAPFNIEIVYLPVFRRYLDRTSPLELLSFALSGIFYALFFVRRQKYDICLAIHGIPSGWVALFMHKVFRIPYLVSLRGGDVPGFLPESYDNLHKKVRSLNNRYWGNSRLLIANSRGLKEIADTTANRLGKRVGIIPNGIDSQFFRPNYSLRDKQRIKLLYAGRITLQKGLENFIYALLGCRLRVKNNFTFEIVGEGPLKNYLKAKYAGLIEEDRLTFSQWLSKEELLLRYQRAQIFVLPSLYEGMSNSLLEAMACGCMVIASCIAGTNELVRDRQNGFLFKNEDRLNLQDVLIEALNSEYRAIEEMGRVSRSIAEKYSWEDVGQRYVDYFTKFSREG